MAELSLVVIGLLAGMFLTGLVHQRIIDADRRDAYARGLEDRATAEAEGWHQGYTEGFRDGRLTSRFGRGARPDDVTVRSN